MMTSIMKKLLRKSASLLPYLPFGLMLLPGGSLLTLMVWLHQHKDRQN